MTQETYADSYCEGIKIMAQKTSGGKTAVNAKKEYPATHGVVLVEIEIPHQAPSLGTPNAKPEPLHPASRSAPLAGEIGSHDPQDDTLWDAAIENSIDAIRELADKALADRQAGRTKKITI